MNKDRKVLLIFCLVILAWLLLFPTTQAASSSPLLGFTLTPTTPPQPSSTPVVPTKTPVATSISLTDTPVSPSKTPGNTIATLPPPSTHPGVLIPVTGANRSAAAGSNLLITAGLIVAAIGLAFLGFSKRKK